MVNIKITIDPYIKEDRYRVNVYIRGSAIPLLTKDLPANSDPIVIFKDAPDNDYDGEVVHYCDNTEDPNDTKTLRKQIFTAVAPCNCQPGWSVNTDNTKCVRTVTQPPTITALGVGFAVAPGPNEAAYCREGIKVYGNGFSLAGTGGTVYASGPGHLYWSSQNTTSNGRLNIAGVWNQANASAPLNQWIGFTVSVNVALTKVYFIGIAGDDFVRIKVNGAVVVDQKQNAGVTNANFNYWHVYPIKLNAGQNIIELEGWNNESQGCFAAEIYNCDVNALQNVTPGTEATLNRIWSSLDMFFKTFTNAYSCTDGFALDLTDPNVPLCKKIEYTDCG